MKLETEQRLLKDGITHNLLMGKIDVDFLKKDESQRTMICSLKSEFIPETDKEQAEKKASSNPNLVKVYEIGVGWRSFDMTRLVDVRFPDDMIDVPYEVAE